MSGSDREDSPTKGQRKPADAKRKPADEREPIESDETTTPDGNGATLGDDENTTEDFNTLPGLGEPAADQTQPDKPVAGNITEALSSVDEEEEADTVVDDPRARSESKTSTGAASKDSAAETSDSNGKSTESGKKAPASAKSSDDAPKGAAGDRAEKADASKASDKGEPKTRSSGIEVHVCGVSDVGLVREHNEDNFLVADLESDEVAFRGGEVELGDAEGDDTPTPTKRPPADLTVGPRGVVMAVCDGMGGAAAGEVASQMAVDTLHEILRSGGNPGERDVLARRMVRAVEEAGGRIFSSAKMDRTRRGMGTTSTVAALIDQVLFVGQVGDSRAYILRGEELVQITKDQSLVNQLIEAGQLSEEEADAFEHSNIILQALGTTEEVVVDLTFLELRQGDRLLLCSDGLSGLVHE